MSEMPVADVDATIAFLTHYAGDEPIVLTAIAADGGGVISRTFTPASEPDLIRSWLDGLNGKMNMYFAVNPCCTPLNGRGIKAKKTDVRAMKALHVDIDPRVGEDLKEERERAVRALQDYDPPASIIIDSGNGFQGFWLLDEERSLDGSPEQLAHLEGFNQHIALVLAADACQDIARVMRLPGTVNLPNKTKRAKGRVPVLASLFRADWQARYPLARFKSMVRAVKPVQAAASASAPTLGMSAGPVSLAALPGSVSASCKQIIVHGHDPDDPHRHPSRSEWLFRVCCELARAGVADDIIYAIITDPDFRISGSVLEKPKWDEYARRQIASAQTKVGEARVANRPVVMLNDSDLHRVLDEVETGLLDKAAPLYQMSGRLVHVERRDSSAIAPEAGGQAGALIINDVSDHRLREYMIEHIEFRRPDEDDDEKPRVSAPTLMHAKHLRARSDKWRLRPLRGIVEAPTLRADGSILAEEGYDDRSGYVADFGGVSFPLIPETPSPADALSALAVLKEPLAGFPFVNDADVKLVGSSSRSVALSAILTALCRRSLRSAPLHAFSAPTMATGKSLLADVVSLIATGRSAAVTSQGKNEEEDEKRLLAILMQGDPIIVVDNVERPISGDALASILTQEQWQSRMLGLSKQVQVPTNVLFIATGNNVSFKGDMSTRAIVARIDAGVEAPETRAFTGDLRAEVRARRPDLVAAGLTILRAFHIADRPGLVELERFGRYESWSATVRGALVWLGEADPCLSRAFVAQRDLARDEHHDLMEAWLVEFTLGTVVRAAEVVERAREAESTALKEALEGVCPLGPTPKRLGHYLAKVDGRWLNGLCIEQIPNQKQGARYRLKGDASMGPTEQTKLVF